MTQIILNKFEKEKKSNRITFTRKNNKRLQKKSICLLEILEE